MLGPPKADPRETKGARKGHFLPTDPGCALFALPGVCHASRSLLLLHPPGSAVGASALTAVRSLDYEFPARLFWKPAAQSLPQSRGFSFSQARSTLWPPPFPLPPSTFIFSTPPHPAAVSTARPHVTCSEMGLPIRPQARSSRSKAPQRRLGRSHNRRAAASQPPHDARPIRLSVAEVARGLLATTPELAPGEAPSAEVAAAAAHALAAGMVDLQRAIAAAARAASRTALAASSINGRGGAGASQPADDLLTTSSL